MNAKEGDLDTRVTRLERRVRTLVILTGVLGCLAFACMALSASQTYTMREARANHDFARRKIELLEMRLDAGAAGDNRCLVTLEKQMGTLWRDARSAQLPMLRRWFVRADRAMSENRSRIERLEGRPGVLPDSMGTTGTAD